MCYYKEKSFYVKKDILRIHIIKIKRLYKILHDSEELSDSKIFLIFVIFQKQPEILVLSMHQMRSIWHF